MREAVSAPLPNYTARLTGFDDKTGKPVAKPYVDDAAAVYEYALSLKLEEQFVDFDALSVLLNYGYLRIDAKNSIRRRRSSRPPRGTLQEPSPDPFRTIS